MNISERLKKIRKEKGLSQAKLAKMTGTTQQAIQKIEVGVSKGSRVADEIAKVLNIHPSWLKYGENDRSETYVSENLYTHAPRLEWKKLKQIDFKDTDPANQWAEYDQTVALPLNLCSKKTFVLVVKGDFMTSPIPGSKTFLPGEIIGVDPEKEPCSNCYVIARADSNSEPVFRQYIEDGSKRYLRALNPNYPMIEFQPTMSILGVVVIKLDDTLYKHIA